MPRVTTKNTPEQTETLLKTYRAAFATMTEISLQMLDDKKLADYLMADYSCAVANLLRFEMKIELLNDNAESRIASYQDFLVQADLVSDLVDKAQNIHPTSNPILQAVNQRVIPDILRGFSLLCEANSDYYSSRTEGDRQINRIEALNWVKKALIFSETNPERQHKLQRKEQNIRAKITSNKRPVASALSVFKTPDEKRPAKEVDSESLYTPS